jgi:DNA-binding CsgD family transcriptional regulator
MIDIQNHIYLIFAKDIDQICLPIKKFGIKYFSYIKNFNNGAQIYLSNSSDWVKNYYEKSLYKTSLFEGPPSLYRTGYVLWPANSNKEVFKLARDTFDSGDGITFSNRLKNSCEFFFFSGAVENKTLINFFLTNIGLLQRFIVYFKDKASKILNKAETCKIIIPDHFRYLVTDDETNFIAPIFNKKDALIEAFLHETKIKRYTFQDVTHYRDIILSAREIDCAIGLLEGKTAQELANNLSLSRRTVETHLDALKIKLNCYKKSELTTMLQHSNFNKIMWQ